MNDSPRQNPAYRKSILSFLLTLNKWVKKVLLVMMAIASLALAQDTPPADSEEPQVLVLEFDERCAAPIRWAMYLMIGREAGITEQTILQDLYKNPGLRNSHPDTISYMIVIVGFVFDPAIDPTTVNGAQEILRNVEQTCTDFLDHLTETPPPKKQTTRT